MAKGKTFATAESKKAKKVSKSSKGTGVRELKTLNFAAEYRPRKVEDYVGQDHILKTFAGWIKEGTFPSTILITGNTGSGKTTFARMIGQYINCETLDACGECSSCRAALSGHNADIMEYDMGDVHGKVEGSANIISSAVLSPRYRRRVFILDESHLMSAAAESKFLKITEEPPQRTVWIFVTTDPQKMKDTMIGRMTRLNIQPIDPSIISDRLRLIAKEIKIWPKDKDDQKKAKEALNLIAEYAGGQMRGAIGMLQTVWGMVKGGEEFSKNVVNEVAAADPEIDLESKAVEVIAAYLDMDVTAVIGFMREANNPRGLLNKMRWTLHYTLGEQAGTNKFKTAGLKMLLNLCRQEKIQLNPVALIYLQRKLADLEGLFNSTSVPETIQMESGICSLMCDIYRNEISMELGNKSDDEEDEKPKKKKKKKKSKD